MKLLKRPVYQKQLVVVTALLCIIGLISLFSASLSALDSQAVFYRILSVQLLSLIIGGSLVYLAVYLKAIDYRCLYKKSYALYFFLATLLLQALVLTPLGVMRNGATRWLDIGITVIQPSELFKIAIIMMLAFLIVRFRKEITHPLYALGIIGSLAVIFIGLMILIRDMGTLIITCTACFAVLVVSRVKLRHTIGSLVVIVVVMAGFLLYAPQGDYIRDRISSHININYDPQGAGFQIKQSLMTIGAGEISGRGFGESLQKHQYLPEPLTDSIFAVFSEEWGFVGNILLLTLYFLLLYYGLRIAIQTRDEFGRYVATGLIVLIITQALYNIMAMLNIVPLSGMPLIFMSKGGSSLVTSLLIIAILANISRVTLTNRRGRTA